MLQRMVWKIPIKQNGKYLLPHKYLPRLLSFRFSAKKLSPI